MTARFEPELTDEELRRERQCSGAILWLLSALGVGAGVALMTAFRLGSGGAG